MESPEQAVQPGHCPAFRISKLIIGTELISVFLEYRTLSSSRLIVIARLPGMNNNQSIELSAEHQPVLHTLQRTYITTIADGYWLFALIVDSDLQALNVRHTDFFIYSSSPLLTVPSPFFNIKLLQPYKIIIAKTD